MNKIVSPLKSQMKRAEVGDLHQALIALGFEIAGKELKEHRFGAATRKAVRAIQKKHGLKLSGAVDKATANAINRLLAVHSLPRDRASSDMRVYSVKGKVTLADGSSADEVTVSAFDRDLRSEQLLGHGKTDNKGLYQIQYSSSQFRKQEKGGADLVVKVLAANGSVLAASPVVFNAPASAEVNLTIPLEKLLPPSLFEKIGRELKPLLKGLPLKDLEEDKQHQDLSFLSGESGVAKNEITRFVLAHKLVRDGLPVEFWFVMLGGSSFQFAENQSLKEQAIAIVNSLSSLNTTAVQSALTNGLNRKDIPEGFRKNVAGWVETFAKFAASRTVSESAERSFVRLALDHAGIKNAKKQETFAHVFNEHKALTRELLAEIEKDKSFKKDEIADLQASFRLAEITQGDFSLVKMLKDEFGVRKPEQIRALAKKSEAEWVKLIKAKHAARAIELTSKGGQRAGVPDSLEAEMYAKNIERRFREAFPTTAFAGGLDRALANGGARGLRHAKALKKFLDRHESFELLNTPVDEFMKTNVNRDFRAIADEEDFRLEVKAVQRVFKLAPTFEATDALLADDLHSAQKVYRMGESEFVRSYSGRPGFEGESARLAWNRAADTHAAVLTIIGDLKALEPKGLPLVLRNGMEGMGNRGLSASDFPNWENLFQAGDICECESCRSALSPAAYFADILMFLKDRNANTTGKVKDVLFKRRPDLGYLELSCDNALTPLPYVDVVCEVLEDAVAQGKNDIEFNGFTKMLSPGRRERPVRDAFAAKRIYLADDFSISQVVPGDLDRWIVRDANVTYLLKKKKNSDNFFAEILRNTKTSAAELRAYPQYVNAEAYKKLQGARYPHSLPFDLSGEEVRAGFQKCNLQRWDLMRTLQGASTPNNPTDGDIAAEYFDIGCGVDLNDPNARSEKKLILEAETDEDKLKTNWGEHANPNWNKETDNGNVYENSLRNVKKFLLKTGLEYSDLLTLLDMKFINPLGNITILHHDSSCDTKEKIIHFPTTDNGVSTFDRIHRFLRLWRKLKGWKMWELDLVIRHPHIGNPSPAHNDWLLNEQFLINLFYFCEVRKKLGGRATVEEVCALFGNLNTKTRFTKLFEKREVALYQSLFLNRRLIQPLDPAFEVSKVDGSVLATEKISNHHPVVLAALGIREADLLFLKGLTKPDGTRYINDDLTLANLSFLWRLAWLSRLLKFKVEDWKLVLKIFQQPIAQFFVVPLQTLKFIEELDQLKAAGFTLDELNWLLAADRSAKAAMKETDAARFLAGLRKELEAIKTEYGVEPPTDADGLTTLLTSLLQKLNRSEAEVSFFLATLRGSVQLEVSIKDKDLPSGFTFSAVNGPPNYIPIQYDKQNSLFRFIGIMTDIQKSTLLGIMPDSDPAYPAYKNAIEELHKQAVAAATNYLSIQIHSDERLTLPRHLPSIPIRYNATTQTLSFIGVMTNAERTALIDVNRVAAIDKLYQLPRRAVKFFEPVFTAPLEALPPAVDFKAQLPAELAAKITYDSEQRLLRFIGFMSHDDKANLHGLVPYMLPIEVAYHSAVDTLFTQPNAISDDRVWLADNDLDETQPANNTFAKRATNAAKKALGYLSRTLVENTVVQQCNAQLGLTEALTRYMLTQYKVVPINSVPPTTTKNSLLTHLTGDFTIDATTLNCWYWANRVATIWKKWKLTLAELKNIVALTTLGALLDFLTLPLDSSGAVALIENFLRTDRLFKLRDSLPETTITLLEVLEKLNEGKYANAKAFAADVHLLNDDWLASEVEALIASIDLAYPEKYLLAETWERMRRAFYFVDSLNAGVDTVKQFAAAAMTPDNAKTLKELLRSKFGTETWLSLSTEIQDALRERKREALAAYLLAQNEPVPSSPTGKWENTNDLYAYYLLDVEMSACQLTSRLVQASGTVQLFVQRCFMGLEPDVTVNADGASGDSAWRWWKWMRKYRVWEANRKVFLWPENWIEPELKKDKSEFFKEMEDELLQNEINQYTVETAFQNYLEKLDGVAQLEIAGFYQEDDGDNTIIHVFGRTMGAEPHLYYYRRYDYRQWTPWEKVELDIEGDFLIPAVVNKRLFLFWPVFTEVPDEKANNTIVLPVPPSKEGETFTPTPIMKKLKLQMAMSDYRQGKWTPKRVSKDFDTSSPYKSDPKIEHLIFYPTDRSVIDGGFNLVHYLPKLYEHALDGAFDISGCKGVPEPLPDFPLLQLDDALYPSKSVRSFLKWVRAKDPSQRPPPFIIVIPPYGKKINILGSKVLGRGPSIFKVTPALHLSYFDKIKRNTIVNEETNNDYYKPVGSWLPFFYNDKKRTFFVLPTWPYPVMYYSEIKKKYGVDYDKAEKNSQDQIDLYQLPLDYGVALRLEHALYNEFPSEIPEPDNGNRQLEDYQILGFKFRSLMRFFTINMSEEILDTFRSALFHFKTFYHPFVCDFAKLVYDPLQGIPALMSRETQLKNSGFRFKSTYLPTEFVIKKDTEEFYPKEIVDFSPDGAYACYNWELFFHAPLMIANSLSKNQRFEEARDWYHFIFNPIGVESTAPFKEGVDTKMRRYWITKPFFETTDAQYVKQRIDNILRMLAGDTDVKDLEEQVRDWRTNPFEPHRIANYRTVAYQKKVVMKYLDNLIAWGDNLFRQDSMESINEATQLYILAAEILGPRPKKIPPRGKPSVESFNELEKEFDKFSNALVQVENFIPVQSGNGQSGGDAKPLPMLYFCIPQNDQMLGYWDTVADRLYKIRHCMNIEGVVRQLALFEPPIDPAALVKAVAGGADIGAALADLNAPLPLYRFNVLLQKANEVCNDVKALGGALLAALEKKDAEAIGLLRQSQELRLLEAVKALREKQIEEAKENRDGFVCSKATVEERRNFYRDIEKVIDWETTSMVTHSLGIASEVAATVLNATAGVAHLVPEATIGASGLGSPVVTVKYGGSNVGASAFNWAAFFSGLGGSLHSGANIMATQASNERRWEDWKLQERLAEKELAQLEKSFASSELRVAIAEKELENHVLQIENAKATDEFMRSKYTNKELYQWQVGQISAVYFQSYRLAYDLAKRAERCFRFELGLQESSFINFGYWDSLKKGLLSGEKLQYDLRRLETAYLEQNRREFELTKHISLAMLDPLALVKLRETGRCFFNIPEEHFDLDYPGHYFRRIKSVSITLPCVVGPYTTVSCTMRLAKNSIRIKTTDADTSEKYPRHADENGLPADDDRFIENNIPVKAIAASNAQNDSGVFELNFRDERYLPFEGAGAISDWSLELFNDKTNNDFGKPLRQFDYKTISDAIVHIKYTAREDAGAFKNGAVKHLRDYFWQDDKTPSVRMFNLRQEFPSQWQRFLHPANSTDPNVFELDMSLDLFRIMDGDKTLKVNTIWVFARCTMEGSYQVVITRPTGSDTMPLGPLPKQYGDLYFGQKGGDQIPLGIEIVPAKWKLTMTGGTLPVNPEQVQDLVLVLGYQWEKRTTS